MRFAVCAATLAAAYTLVAAGPAGDPLAAVAAAAGHAAGVHIRATATRIVEGRTITTTFDQFGTSRLVQRCVAGACGGTWFDGDRRWTFGLNDVALPEPVDDETVLERTLCAIVSYAFAEPAFRASGGTAVAAGPNRWRVRARGGADLIAVLDAAGDLVRVETASGTFVAAYGRTVRTGGASFPLDRTGAFESTAFDGAVAVAGGLTAPAGAPVAFAPGDDAAALADEPVPVVACSIAGHPERCLLDSGATPSAVTLGVAETLHLEPHGELEIAGFGRFATGFIETGPLALGPARFARARFAVVPGTRAVRFDVVVGSDLLARMRVAIDRARGTVRFAPSGAGALDGNTVPLAFRAGSPVVTAQFAGERRRALLDTGDEAVVSLGYAEYRDGPLWPVIGRAQAAGIGGAEDVFTVQLPDTRVGELDLGPTRATVRRTQAAPHVGIGLWARFRIVLEEATGRIVFSSP